MVCAFCKKESNAASRICPDCGRYIGEEPPQQLPVGEAVPVTYDDDYTRPEVRPGSRKNAGKRRRRRAARKHGGRDAYRRVMVNWAMVGLVVMLLVVATALGGFVYLKVTPNGQLMLARLGRDASADAYWTLGMEYLDQGYITRSIDAYHHALELEPEHPALVNNLMKLAEAYETAGQPREAEDIYTRIYTELQPESPLGYRNVIRLMQQEERVSEAVELMQEAYDKTGDDSFFKQRAALVPLPPTARESSGRHLRSVKVEFISPQGYDIYYISGDGLLPENGTLYTEPFTVGEGSHTFRAVCISSVLMSDEMEVKYVVTLPQPPAPKSNLAPGTYNGARYVRLRDMETDKSDPRKQNELYYTIDGTAPSADSPRYTDEPIRLPSGRPTLRAIAINGYGKVSSELVIQYTIKDGKFKDYFNGTDEFKGMTMMKTTYEQFVDMFGEPQRVADIEDDAINARSTQATWQWGEARFAMLDTGNVLYHISTTGSDMTGPRGAKVGMDMPEVTSRFRDMGQLPNHRGDRGIYYDIKDGYARYRVESDDPGTGLLNYVATLYDPVADRQNTRLLDFEIEGGKVTRMTFRYVDRKISIIM